MTSPDDRIAELEQKVAKLEKDLTFLHEVHRQQVDRLMYYIREFGDRIDQLSSLVPDIATIEKLALDAYAASHHQAHSALREVDRVFPLDMQPQIISNQLSTNREARRET